MGVKIIIDSTAGVNPAIIDRFPVVPLTIHFGETEYVDGVEITSREFYEKLVESDVLPTTSQATPAAFTKVYEEVTANGDTAVVITVASGLSGTYQSACIAAEDFAGSIFVVDSKTVAIGTGILAEYALGLAEEGLTAEEIAEIVAAKADDVFVVAMLDTLEYLKRGGRISKTAAFAGGVLSIKPVVAIRDGEITILGKARGSKQGNNLLVQEIQKAGGINFNMPILLGYTGLSDELLKKYIEDSRHIWDCGTDALAYTTLCSVIGTHAGPGAIAAAFFRKEKE